MIILGWIAEVLFFGLCGWLGSTFVKLITLGKVELDYGSSSSGIVAELLGVVVLFTLLFFASELVSHFSG